MSGTGHAKTCRFYAFSSDQRAQEHAFRYRDAQFFLIDFDALGERAEMIAHRLLGTSRNNDLNRKGQIEAEQPNHSAWKIH